MSKNNWPERAYRNAEFMNSPDARVIRVLCEFIEPATRFEKMGIKNTIVFFGSARITEMKEAQQSLTAAKRALDDAASPMPEDLQKRYDQAQRAVTMARYYKDAQVLSKKLTEWSMAQSDPEKRYVICSGGGPGIMEAANRGALEAGGNTIGLNISLPMEQKHNKYLTKELAFEFHYFFIRKFWFANLAKALVVFPGGFGTCDELFELLTLIQTGKTSTKRAIVVYGSDYWDDVIHFDAMLKWGTISQEDMQLFRFVNDVDSAFDYLTETLEMT